MTTPPTPAGWYPDPESSGGLRYWDGTDWTEHRSPAVDAPPAHAAAEPAGDAAVTDEPRTEHVGAHRAPDPEPEREARQEQEARQVQEPEPVLPPTEQPTTRVPLQDWTAQEAPEPLASELVEPAAYPGAPTPDAGSGPADTRKLIMGFGGAVAALLVLLILAAVYAFVIHKDNTVAISAPTTTESSTAATTSEEPTSEATTASEAPAVAGDVGTDGPLEFTVTGIERATTVTDPTNEFATKDAQGEFIVVRLTVRNTSPDPAQFLGTFQKLNAAGTTYAIDDEASFYAGGGFVEIPPGGQVDVGVAYDVPPGTAPESIELHADPISAGVVLPVS